MRSLQSYSSDSTKACASGKCKGKEHLDPMVSANGKETYILLETALGGYADAILAGKTDEGPTPSRYVRVNSPAGFFLHLARPRLSL